jgi:hypothetical protein
VRSAAGPRLSLVPAPASETDLPAPPDRGALSGWGPDAWREVFEEWRWWAGAGLALVVVGLAESFALPVQAAPTTQGPGGEWLLTALSWLFEGGPLAGGSVGSVLRSVLAAAASGALLAVPWLWLQRSRAEQASRESRRIERSLFLTGGARKKWWPRS